MCHVTKYCNVILPHCTVRRDTACIHSSPDSSLLLRKWVWLARLVLAFLCYDLLTSNHLHYLSSAAVEGEYCWQCADLGYLPLDTHLSHNIHISELPPSSHTLHTHYTHYTTHTLHTLHNTHTTHTTHITQHTHYTHYTQYTLHTLHTLHTPYSLHTPHCTPYTLHTPHCTHYTHHTAHTTHLHTPHYTHSHTTHCTYYTHYALLHTTHYALLHTTPPSCTSPSLHAQAHFYKHTLHTSSLTTPSLTHYHTHPPRTGFCGHIMTTLHSPKTMNKSDAWQMRKMKGTC